jgi:hypothetical protein
MIGHTLIVRSKYHLTLCEVSWTSQHARCQTHFILWILTHPSRNLLESHKIMICGLANYAKIFKKVMTRTKFSNHYWSHRCVVDTIEKSSQMCWYFRLSAIYILKVKSMIPLCWSRSRFSKISKINSFNCVVFSIRLLRFFFIDYWILLNANKNKYIKKYLL